MSHPSSTPINNQTTKLQIRRFPRSVLDSFGRWASQHIWFTNCESSPSTDSLASSFTSDVSSATDCFFPKKTVRLHPTDKPWITPSIKNLISTRQIAFSSGDDSLWRRSRNLVRSAITKSKKSFFTTKVKQLSHSDPRKWWSLVGKLSGKPSSSPPISIVQEGKTIDGADLANLINNSFLNVANDLPPLDATNLPTFLAAPEPPPSLLIPDVCQSLIM